MANKTSNKTNRLVITVYTVVVIVMLLGGLSVIMTDIPNDPSIQMNSSSSPF